MTEWSRLHLVTAPTDDVLTLVQAKQHLRITYDDEDAYINAAIAAARAFIEGPDGAGICLTPQTWRMSLDIFPGAIRNAGRASHAIGYQMGNYLSEIRVPLGPVTAINSITYKDFDGNPQTVTDFRVDYDTEPCRIWPARDQAWPIVLYEPGAVKVEFVAGFVKPPANLGWAMSMIVSHLYEHRETVVGVVERSITPTEVPFGATAIINRYRVGIPA